MSIETGKYLDPKNDYAFKRIFGSAGSEADTMSMLNTLLRLKKQEQIQTLEFVDKEILPDTPEKKRSLVDVRCKDGKGNEFIIEMQNAGNSKFFIQRSQIYGSTVLVNQLRKGSNYDALVPVIVLLIVNYDIFPQDAGHINFYETRNRENSNKGFDLISYATVNLVRYRDNKTQGILKISKAEDHWLNFLADAPKETNPPTGAIKEIVHAYRIMEESNWTDAQIAAYRQLDAEIQLFESSVAEGVAKGMAKGKTEEKTQIAKNLLSQGVDINTISLATGLKHDQIKSLK